MNLSTTCRNIKRHYSALQASADKLAMHFKGKSIKQVKAELLKPMASAYKVKLVEGKGKAKGTLVLNSNSPDYEACRKMIGRVAKAVTTKRTPKPKVVASQPRYSRKVQSLIKALREQFDSAKDARKAFNALIK